MSRLEEIKKRLDAATPGPWEVRYNKFFADIEERYVDGICSNPEDNRIVETDSGVYFFLGAFLVFACLDILSRLRK